MTADDQNREPAHRELAGGTAPAGGSPRVADLPPALGAAARGVAERLAGAGHRAWIVGGAVRDLVLGRVPGDIDMASAALPEEVERLFAWTLPVGKAFGTVLVRWPEPAREPTHEPTHEHGREPEGTLAVEVTTFRTETGYSDGRRPDRVEYGTTLEQDAARRDFTCNALFLDPLADELRDPTGGLDDLRTGVLRCVGDPRRRFAEDGLRLLRMARFAAAYGLEPEAEVLAAARDERSSLRGVSAERIYAELSAIFERPGAGRALELLVRCELLSALASATAREPGRIAPVLEALPQPVGVEAGFAVLFEGEDDPGAALAALRAPLVVRRTVERLWTLRRELEALDATSTRADRFFVLRDELFDQALHLALASCAVGGLATDELQRLALERSRLSRAELFPEPLIVSADLEAQGLPPGRAWGEILGEAERAQLDGVFADRETALRWLTERVAP